jgi:peptidoglycan/xylan/chitin deacetylase (PgdA/CDA1 family)
MVNVPILTYHSQNIAGAQYALNDHVALKTDLELISESGFKIVPLIWLTSWLTDHRNDEHLSNAVCLTFDDGCNYDVEDLEHPAHGLQRSFLGIMEDFRRDTKNLKQQHLHATSFVIASAKARRTIDTSQLFERDWISHDWWRKADQHELLSIENHGWDHNHPDLDGADRGDFLSVNNQEKCIQQVVKAASRIEASSSRWPCLFAYPFGESSDYIREIFFPQHGDSHRCDAALGTRPEKVNQQSDRWDLPRFVCGRDWNSPQGLKEILLG